MSPRIEDWTHFGVIGFMAGIVSNIVLPARRGLLGFLSAAIIGVFCGGVSGLVAQTGGWPDWAQYLTVAIIGVTGDRILSVLLKARVHRQGAVEFRNYIEGDQIMGDKVKGDQVGGSQVNIKEVNDGQNNFGDNDIAGNQLQSGGADRDPEADQGESDEQRPT